MKYLSVCSGIEAATVAWHPLGWEPVAFSEIEPFPSAVLAHHYPDVPNMGDMTKHKEWNLDPIDLFVGGTPCQSFSVAGLRKGLDDPRGNLMLTYLAIADQRRPTWLVWENVPGVLSSGGGRDFGTFLGGLGELGYGFAYRVLDAQYFGVAQRRRRVFVVGYLGDWRPAAAVLFERDSLCGNPAPSRQAGKGFARTAGTLTANGGGPQGVGASDDGVMYTLTKADVHGVAQPISFHPTQDPISNADICHALGANSNATAAVAQPIEVPDVAGTMLSRRESGGRTNSVDHAAGGYMLPMQGMAVRRLTPVECERLQGFPDNYTAIPWRKSHAPDGPRYKALGNSMAVPVMRWIGKRIQEYMNEHHHPGH